MALRNPVTGGSWNTLPLNASFAAAGAPFLAPAYRRDSFGIVYLRGTANYVSGNVGAICTLPAGFRPTATARFKVSSVDVNSALSVAWLDLSSNGNLTYIGGTAYSLTFDQISFSTY